MKSRCFLALLIGTLLLTGCGQSGPLYMPHHQSATHHAEHHASQ